MQISFIIGVAIGFVAFVGICLVSPPPHVQEGEKFLDDERFSNSVSGAYVEPSPKVDTIDDKGETNVRVQPV